MIHASHTFPAFYQNDSQILILGSFPSIESRKVNFYYGHPSNRFWKLMKKIYGVDELNTIEDKKDFLKKHHIALYDVIEECDIVGSSDSSIKNIIPTDLNQIIKNSNIKDIYTNGSLADKYYQKYHYHLTNIKNIALPSTSSANARMNFDMLLNKWNIIKKHL